MPDVALLRAKAAARRTGAALTALQRAGQSGGRQSHRPKSTPRATRFNPCPFARRWNDGPLRHCSLPRGHSGQHYYPVPKRRP